MPEHKYTIPRWISLLYRTGQTYIGNRLKHHEVGKGQFMFLNALYREDGLSQDEIADYLRIDKGTTAKALKKLEEQGYVTRQAREDDKRFNRVFLTAAALEIKDEVRGVLTDWRSLLTEGFTETEKEQALTLLERMGDNAARYMKEAPSQREEEDVAGREGKRP
ncbi:MarR family winged helix-turn-helix transcriptional regulator [Paenibacillus sp. MBLB4367]|uniref:MarR family winged helix-turn-helix transcriptional regulator n=1 Tax=Paenibacillus sp. MBLB4367 TaxID=3384767 RepID=UPI0039082DA9